VLEIAGVKLCFFEGFSECFSTCVSWYAVFSVKKMYDYDKPKTDKFLPRFSLRFLADFVAKFVLGDTPSSTTCSDPASTLGLGVAADQSTAVTAPATSTNPLGVPSTTEGNLHALPSYLPNHSCNAWTAHVL